MDCGQGRGLVLAVREVPAGARASPVPGLVSYSKSEWRAAGVNRPVLRKTRGVDTLGSPLEIADDHAHITHIEKLTSPAPVPPAREDSSIIWYNDSRRGQGATPVSRSSPTWGPAGWPGLDRATRGKPRIAASGVSLLTLLQPRPPCRIVAKQSDRTMQELCQYSHGTIVCFCSNSRRL